MGGIIAGGATGAAMGSFLPGVGNVIGGIVGTLVAGVATYLKSSSNRELELREKERQWSLKGYDERLTEVQDTREQAIQDLEQAIKDGDKDKIKILQEQIKGYDKLAESLQSMIELQNKIREEVNQTRIEIGVEAARLVDENGVKGQYLTELNIGQLKQLGIKGIYDLVAKEIGETGLIGLQMKDSSGKYTQAFLDKASSILKQDEEIKSILSGESYTLSEFFTEYQRTGNNNNQFNASILKNFSNALGTTITDQNFSWYKDRYSNLKLSELYMSTDDMREQIGSLTSLTDAITSNGGNISE